MAETENRNCQNCNQGFAIEPDDFGFYAKVKVPPPTFCPDCRLQRRLAWRNERSLYRRTCSLCQKPIISVYSDESAMNVYCNPCWWSDKWDPFDYGAAFDPARPFLTQWSELLRRVPVPPLFGLYPSLVNSDYTNMVGYLKNCYFITHSDYNENCAYGGFITNSKDSQDNFFVDQCELCYMSVNCRGCYKTFFSLDCESCQNVYFSRNCVGCSECFGCVNLRQKKYYIFNEPYSKEEYEQKLKEFYPSSRLTIEAIQGRLKNFWNAWPQKFMHESHNAQVSGDYLYNSKNAHNSFIVADVEDARFCAFVTPGGLKDAWDFTHYGPKAEMLYESLQSGEGKNMRFTWLGMGSSDAEYSAFAVSCHNIFGVVSMRSEEYCILNKKYSKEEFESLRAQIVAQMDAMPYGDRVGRTYAYGEFFPQELSPFAYNETTAQLYFPMTEPDAQTKGVRWKVREAKSYQITMRAGALAESSDSIPDTITQEVIECLHKGECSEGCATAFRIIPDELQFYKRHKLPLPQLCPQCRYYSLWQQTNPMKLWNRRCMCGGGKSENGAYANTGSHFHGSDVCPNEFETSYAPERPEVVYCERCYNSEIL